MHKTFLSLKKSAFNFVILLSIKAAMFSRPTLYMTHAAAEVNKLHASSIYSVSTPN